MLEEHFSYEDDSSQEYVLEQEYQSEEYVSEEDLPFEPVLEEDFSEEHDSAEDLSEEHDSEVYLSKEQYMSEEHDSKQEYMSKEHDSEDVDFIDVVGISEESDSENVDFIDVEGFSEEYDSEEEDLPKEHSYKAKNWLENYYFNEKWLKEHGFGKNCEHLSTLYENRVKEHGFVFKRQTVAKKECVVEIVLVGKENCGKTQLIEAVFGDHPSLTVTNHETQNEYRIHLSENLSFHVWIYDVKDTEFVIKTYFRYETVFIFCFAYDDPGSFAHIENIWIPLLSQKPMKRMFRFLVGIERDIVTKQKAVAGINTRKNKRSMMEKAAVLLRQLHAGLLTECYTEDKKSMVNIFQSAFNAVYP